MARSFSRRAFLQASLGFVATLPLARAAVVASTDAAPVDFSGELAAIFADTKIPGAAALALHGERIVARGVTGVRKNGAPERIGFDDTFHLGSCTKAMTATLLGTFVDEKRVRWDTPLTEIFGDVKNVHAGWRRVTLRHVLAHRAGLPPNLGPKLRARLAASSLSMIEQRRLIAAELLAAAPASEPGAKFLYANNGFTLIGAALEQIGGRAWEELMRERIFAPLGLASGGFGAPGRRGNVGQPWGHRANGTPVEPGPRADNLAAIGPAGRVHLTMGDWANFAALHLRGDPGNPRSRAKLLSADAFRQLHRPPPGETYVGGWGTGTRRWARGSRVDDTGFTLSHSGSNTMWFCVVWLAPEIDFGALVACNIAGDGVPALCDKAIGTLIRDYAKRPA